jgi:predicted O-methyltransferase YrrM
MSFAKHIDMDVVRALNIIHHGWCSTEKAFDLTHTIIGSGAKTIVEIGVFGGRSMIPMAMACKYQGFGKVIGIDPWDAKASSEWQSHPADIEWWSKLDHDLIYAEFIRCVHLLGVEDFCDIQRMRSDEYQPVGPIDLLHIDGNHSDQALRDVKRYASLVPVGGFVFADDIGWTGGGVQRAVFELESLGFEKQYDRDTGAMFKRVRNDTFIP